MGASLLLVSMFLSLRLHQPPMYVVWSQKFICLCCCGVLVLGVWNQRTLDFDSGGHDDDQSGEERRESALVHHVPTQDLSLLETSSIVTLPTIHSILDSLYSRYAKWQSN